MSAGREAQLEELVGLEAVFGEDVKIDTTSYSCFAYLPSLTASPHVTLKINLPESYPEHSAPELEVLAAHLRQSTRARLAEQLKARFSPGRWAQRTVEHLVNSSKTGSLPTTSSLPEQSSKVQGLDLSYTTGLNGSKRRTSWMNLCLSQRNCLQMQINKKRRSR